MEPEGKSSISQGHDSYLLLHRKYALNWVSLAINDYASSKYNKILIVLNYSNFIKKNKKCQSLLTI